MWSLYGFILCCRLVGKMLEFVFGASRAVRTFYDAGSGRPGQQKFSGLHNCASFLRIAPYLCIFSL
jgi:hypothetical protein